MSPRAPVPKSCQPRQLNGAYAALFAELQPACPGLAEIIVATGSAPRSVPGIAIDRTRIITSDEAIHLKQVPKSIVILGSGAVGVEFASIFRRFGSEVTVVELLPRLVPVEDEAVSAASIRWASRCGRRRDRMDFPTATPPGQRRRE